MAEGENANFSRFCKAISYSLVRLRAPEFTLKDEQKKALLAVYEGRGRLCEPTSFGRSIYFQILPFVFAWLLKCTRGSVYIFMNLKKNFYTNVQLMYFMFIQ